MKVLMISSDKEILRENSEARQRMIEYGRLVEELRIIILTRQNFQFSIFNFQNVYVFPANIFNAIKIGKKLPRPDLVTSQDAFEIGFIAWRLAKYFKAKLQLQLHTDFLSPYFKKESIKNYIRVWLAKFLIPRANCLRVVSKRIFNQLVRFNLASWLLPIWVDVEKIKNTPIKIDLHKKYPQFDFIILMASRLTKEKNIGLAIDTACKISEDHPNVGLIIVGSGPEKKKLEARIKKLELARNVILEKWTDDPASYYKTCDLFLLTSNYEGYGRTLVEAAAVGCKIVSSDVGIADEILEKENIFKVGDKNDLTEKIRTALSGKLKPAKALDIKTKEEYLTLYKTSWEHCCLKNKQ